MNSANVVSINKRFGNTHSEELMPDLRQRCLTGKPRDDKAPADALVLFGAMGDLAHKKIFPALYHMVRHGHLDVPVIGIARGGRTETDLKERVRDSIQKLDGNFDQQALAKLLELLRYVGGDYGKPETFDLLKKTLGCGWRIVISPIIRWDFPSC